MDISIATARILSGWQHACLLGKVRWVTIGTCRQQGKGVVVVVVCERLGGKGGEITFWRRPTCVFKETRFPAVGMQEDCAGKKKEGEVGDDRHMPTAG
jgi:hypothetical protein